MTLYPQALGLITRVSRKTTNSWQELAFDFLFVFKKQAYRSILKSSCSRHELHKDASVIFYPCCDAKASPISTLKAPKITPKGKRFLNFYIVQVDASSGPQNGLDMFFEVLWKSCFFGGFLLKFRQDGASIQFGIKRTVFLHLRRLGFSVALKVRIGFDADPGSNHARGQNMNAVIWVGVQLNCKATRLLSVLLHLEGLFWTSSMVASLLDLGSFLQKPWAALNLDPSIFS